MIFIDRFEFTYYDYLKYKDSLYWHGNEDLCLQEETEEYIYEEKRNQKHDKIFKEILYNQNEMAKFLTEFINYKIQAEELEIYNTNYISTDFKYKQADIVYKIKGKEIYFLIEHQTKVDYSMPYRILNYCVEIIRSVIKRKEINRFSFKYPKIIPIVLYTGKRKWTASTSFAKVQQGDSYFDYIDISYRLVDINTYNIQDLLKCKTMLANIMILEKCNTIEEVTNNNKSNSRK